MKTKLTLTLLAFAAVSLNLPAATSALPAPLPEFMNDAQAAKWSADQAAAAQTTSVQEPSTQFYTGKPYVADAGGYVYKYRTYNPEMSRWTSADPSGFPDGVNNFTYAKNEASYALDNNGLVTVTGVTTPNLSTIPATYNGITYTISATKNPLQITTNNSVSGTLAINTDTVSSSGADSLYTLEINVSGFTASSSISYNWIQQLTKTVGGTTTSSQDGSPYYNSVYTASASYFYDQPTYSLSLATSSNPVTWNATLSYVGVNTSTGDVYTYATIQWGFTITE